MSGFANIQLALGALPVSGTVVAFTTPGVTLWEVPVGVFSIDILVVGGGGAGNGDSSSPGLPGGGGSGGGVAEFLGVTVTPGDTLTVSVGTGGTNGQYDAAGSAVEDPSPATLAFVPGGSGCNVEVSSDFGNGGGGGCAPGQELFPGPLGGPGGFNGGDGIANDIGTTFLNGGGAGAGEDGHPGLGSLPGDGGNGKDMSSGWGTTYGENGVFGGGGGGDGYIDPDFTPNGSPGLGHGLNCGGGGSSAPPFMNGQGDDGIVLIRY